MLIIRILRVFLETLFSATANNTRNIRNNIFQNDRSTTGGVSQHYAISLTANTNLTCNYNDYWVSGTGGVLGILTTDRANLAAWQTATGQDANSVFISPALNIPNGTSAISYFPTETSIIGVTGTSINTDYSGTIRSLTIPTIGAFEAIYPITVWKSGVKQADYLSLKAAFDDINAGTHTGTLEIRVNHSTTETASAVLNASGSGSANYTSIHIYPTLSGINISGNIDAPLIDLNGADNIIIDGRVNADGTTKSLKISNSSTSSTAGTSTIRFINDATSNTVKYCLIMGAETSTTSGIIYFGNNTSSVGNSNNTIQHNSLTSVSDEHRPVNVIYSSSTAYSRHNSNLLIDNNDIYDFLNKSIHSTGITFTENTKNCTITNNRFYETNIYTPLANVNYIVINVNSNYGNNFQISNNQIGGNDSDFSGVWRKSGEYNNAFTAIYVGHSTGLGVYSNIDNNSIKNFHWTNSANADWTAIRASSGEVNIGVNIGNNIGDTTSTGSILYRANTTGANLFGIYINNNSSTVNCSNNIVGSIQTSNTSTFATNTFGISKHSGAGNANITNNFIGSATVESNINAMSESTSSAQSVYGIYNYGTATFDISNNIIANLKNSTSNPTVGTLGRINGIFSGSGIATISNNTIFNLSNSNSNNSTTYQSSVVGISLNGSSTNVYTVNENIIYNLSNTNNNFVGSISGIAHNGTTNANSFNKNLIHSLFITGSTSTSASLYGINQIRGAATYANNIITLSCNTPTTVYGIYDAGGSSNTCNAHFNTIYISGNLNSGATNKSYCLMNQSGLNTKNYTNNIFFNERSTVDGTSLHYAISLSTSNNLTLDYNNYYTIGIGGVLGVFNTIDKSDLATWKTATTKDISSLSEDPLFTNSGSIIANDYIPLNGMLYGSHVSGILTDYLNNSRVSTPTMGALEGNLSGLVIDIYKTGVLQGSFVSLKATFDAINNGIHTGVMEVRINASTTEIATASLNRSGTGSASYSSLIIFPTNEDVEISGNFTTPLIDFNGASGVTIDGRVNATGNTKSLTIVNSSTASNSFTSTIRFYANAQNNTVKYCTIKGSSTYFYSGVILFGSTTGSWGNYNNTIQYNDITNANGNRPINLIMSYPTSAANYTSTLNISNNNLFDFQNSSATSSGIYLYEYNRNATINGNSFYETTNFTPISGSTSNECYAIQIYSTSGLGFNVTNNYIGGSQPLCEGLPWRKTEDFANNFYGIKLFQGTSTSSIIDNNIISNFDWKNPMPEADHTSNNFVAMYVSGNVNIGTTHGNRIGSIVENEAIVASGSNIWGINTSSSSGNITIENNTIGGLNTTNYSTNGASVYCMYIKSPGTITIRNNTIGSPNLSNSIKASSESTDAIQNIFGVYLNANATGTHTISDNIITNFSNVTNNSNPATLGQVFGIGALAGTNTISNNVISNLSIANANSETNHTNSLSGIVLSGTSNVNTVTRNTIFNLQNSNNTFAGDISGIYFTGNTGANTVSRNFIHSLFATGLSANANIYGIKAVSGAVTYSNNIITIGNNSDNSFYGFYDTGAASQTANLYHNTLYIGGEPTTGTANSYALYSSASSNTRNFRNNIFFNARSNNGASGKHYAAYYNYATTTGLTNNNNAYYTNGVGGILLYYNSSEYNSLIDIQSAMGQDTRSRNFDPNFANSGGTMAVDYIPNNDKLIGALGTGITTDHSGATRASTPTIGAYENLNPLSLPIEIWKSGAFQASYGNIKLAFDAVNAGIHTGILDLKITESVEETTSAILYHSGYNGTSSYASLNIYPTITGLSVSGNLAAPLIDLNGADNVTFDGRVDALGSTKDLIIANFNTSSTAGTSTIRFINDASSNTVKFCKIKGSSISASGILFFSTTTATTGNDNNTIENNDITSAYDNNRPLYAIYSNGTFAKTNNNISIDNNNIFDIISKSSNWTGIYLGSNTTGCSITNNSFYETNTLVPTSSSNCQFINIDNASGTDFTISGNFMGGSAPNCGGAPLTRTAAADGGFNPVRITVGAGTASNYQNNTIANVSWSNNGNSGAILLSINGVGEVNVGTTTGNKFGNPTLGGISFTTNGTTTFRGIYVNCSGVVDIQNNVFESISTHCSNSTIGISLYGIQKPTIAGTTYVINNTIGSTTVANSINATSPSTAGLQDVVGISLSGSVTYTNEISGNTIANITNSSTSGAAQSSKIQGINSAGSANAAVTNNTVRNLTIANANTFTDLSASIAGIAISGNGSQTVTGNTIYNLINTNTSFTGQISGIYYNCSTTNNCSGNFIHTLSADGASAVASIFGIKAVAGVISYTNNIINIGDNTSNTFYGFYDLGATSQTCNVYNNTFYIGGQPTSGASLSAAFWSHANNNTRNYRNNIFHNSRSNNGASGNHYAAYYNYESNTNLTNDYNNYYTDGTGGVLAYYNSADQSTLEDLRINMSMDERSKSINPLFEDLSSQTPESLKIKSTKLHGIAIAEVTHDFGMNLRATVPTMGAWDYDGDNVWVGEISEDWNNPANWAAGKLIDDGDDLVFDESPFNHCVMDQNRTINDVKNNQSTFILKLNGHTLNMNGRLDLSNGALVDGSNNNSTLSLTGAAEQFINAIDFYERKIFNLHINNSNNALLSGSFNVLNELTSSNGAFDLMTHNPTLRYCGTTLQNINSTVFIDDAIKNLIVANNQNVSLVNDLLVKNILEFESGKLITHDKIITIDNGGEIEGTNNTSYIDGFCSKIGNEAFTFPIGKENKYAPVTISAPSEIDDKYTASYYPSNPAVVYSDSTEITIHDISRAEYWLIDREKGENDVSVTLYWNKSRSDIGANYTDLKVVRWDGEFWKNVGSEEIVGTPDSGMVSSSPLSKFSPFSFGVNKDQFLPVELLSFKVHCHSEKVQISWQTASEINNSHFIIEQSTNGISWSKLDSIVGNGNSNQLLEYLRFYNTNSVQSYVRLIQVDFDGKRTVYSPIQNPCSYSLDFSVFPNPTKDKITLVCDPDFVDTFVLFNSIGKTIMHGQVVNWIFR